MSLKKTILAIYNWPYVPISVRDQRQEFIRDFEWKSISQNIRPGRFLDVGCGAGYAMKRAWCGKGAARKHGLPRHS